MIKILDVISKIETYEHKIKDRAFPDSQPVDLKRADTAITYLHDLLKNNKGDSLAFTDYGQLKDYMEAIGIIETYSKLPSLSDIKKKGGITYAELQKALADWHNREKYITVPASFVLEANKMIQPYVEMAKKLSPEKQTLAFSVIRHFQDPVGLFERAKSLTINQVGLMMHELEEKHSDKGAKLSNVYWDKLTKRQVKYLNDFQTWLNHGVDPKYLFTAQTIESTLQNVLEGRVKAIKAKHKKDLAKEDADAKKNDEFRDRSLKTLKDARHDADNQFREAKDENFNKMVREALGVTDRTQHDFTKVQTLYTETQDLPVPPNPADLADLESQAVAAAQENSDARSQIKSLIDSAPK